MTAGGFAILGEQYQIARELGRGGMATVFPPRPEVRSRLAVGGRRLA